MTLYSAVFDACLQRNDTVDFTREWRSKRHVGESHVIFEDRQQTARVTNRHISVHVIFLAERITIAETVHDINFIRDIRYAITTSGIVVAAD